MGASDGVSDFLLIGPPDGRLHAYELKRLGHKATEEQLAFGYDVITAGGQFTWGDSYDHAIEVFQAWGALPRPSIRSNVYTAWGLGDDHQGEDPPPPMTTCVCTFASCCYA